MNRPAALVGESNHFIPGGVIGIIIAILVLSVVFGNWYTVDQSERVVKLRHGVIVGIAGPGLNFKIPFVDMQANAEAICERGVAEGDAIKVRGETLKQNTQLIALNQAEKWNGVLPTTMVSGGAVLLLNLRANASND